MYSYDMKCNILVLCYSIVFFYFIEVENSYQGAPSRGLQALRAVRSHFRDSAIREQQRNFAPYSTDATSRKGKGNKKEKGWIQSCVLKMVCLSSPTEVHVPTSAATKELLTEAGLGETPFSACMIGSVLSSSFLFLILCEVVSVDYSYSTVL